MGLKKSKILVFTAGAETTVSCSPLMLFHYERGFRWLWALQRWRWIITGQIQTEACELLCDMRALACLSLRQRPFKFCMNLCIRHHATSFVCLYLVGCEKRQRLGESCRETLQGLERMLIKASYSTASSFLTVPAAGSTMLCFLTTSSPLSLSALLYFCLRLFLSPSPSVSHLLPFARSSTCHLEAHTADALTSSRRWCGGLHDCCLFLQIRNLANTVWLKVNLQRSALLSLPAICILFYN